MVGVARRFEIALPEQLADAVQGEALRTGERPSVVLAQFIVDLWPSWIVARLRQDLQPSRRTGCSEQTA